MNNIMALISIFIVLGLFLLIMNKTHDNMSKEAFEKALKFREKIAKHRYVIFILLALMIIISYFSF